MVCAQNHDQVGNRAGGDRLSSLADFEALKLAASAVLLSPYVPLLFMGEEYGERTPFLFFTDFEDRALREAVTQGRRKEFAAFSWKGEIADPQDSATFAQSNLNWALQGQEPHRWLWEYYQTLLALRRQHPVMGTAAKRRLEAREVDDRTLLLHRSGPQGAGAFVVLQFGHEYYTARLRIPPGPWRRLVDSPEERFGGLGAKSPAFFPLRRTSWIEIEMAGHGAVVYLREARP